MKKLLFLIMITLPLVYSCGSGCDGMGAGYDKTFKVTSIALKDTSNRLISIVLHKVKYYVYDTINSQIEPMINWNSETTYFRGQNPIISIIIQHKKGIDTVDFEFIRTKPKYEVDECDEPQINFDYNGPFIKSYTFDSVYFQGEKLILE